VVGASGAGKTSLVHLLLRFWDPISGQILIGGSDFRSLNQAELRPRIGVIAQTTTLFNASVRQNIRLADPAAADEAVEKAARLAQIHARILELPQGYDTPIGERGLRLSAGERQRVAIARALLQDPPLLVLDEPTANLDARTGRALLDTLYASVFPGRGELLITHQLECLEGMHEILVLHQGMIVERGTQSELITRGGRFARMYGLNRKIMDEFM
jgi:ABC-type multidrug transport system fused ATPase/permease subunit